jgi:hypothetical protein
MPLHIHNKRYYSENEQYIMPILALTYHLQTLMIMVPFYNISLGEGEHYESVLNLIHSHKPTPFHEHTLEFEKMNDIIEKQCETPKLPPKLQLYEEAIYKDKLGESLFTIEKQLNKLKEKKYNFNKEEYAKLKDEIKTMKRNYYRKDYTKKGLYNTKQLNRYYGMLAHKDYCNMVSALQDKYLPVETLQKIKRCPKNVTDIGGNRYYGTRKSQRKSTKIDTMIKNASDDDSHNAKK